MYRKTSMMPVGKICWRHRSLNVRIFRTVWQLTQFQSIYNVDVVEQCYRKCKMRYLNVGFPLLDSPDHAHKKSEYTEKINGVVEKKKQPRKT